MPGASTAAPLEPGICQVWWATPRFVTEGHVTLLCDVERRRRHAYRRAIDRDRFTLGAALIRIVVGLHTGQHPGAVRVDRACTTCGQPHGKPRLPGTGVEVSVSHSGERVALACTLGAPVGIDVEEVSSGLDVALLAGAVLDASEAAHLATIDEGLRRHAFVTYWTRKEAIVKATGDGLRVPLPSVSVSPPERTPRLLGFEGRPELPGRVVMAQLWPGPDHIASLAVIGGSDAGEEPPLRTVELGALALLAPYA